jgi:hypothetical protein
MQINQLVFVNRGATLQDSLAGNLQNVALHITPLPHFPRTIRLLIPHTQGFPDLKHTFLVVAYSPGEQSLRSTLSIPEKNNADMGEGIS